MAENDKQTPGADKAEALPAPVPEPALSPAEEKKVEAEANQAPDTKLYQELVPTIRDMANMTQKQKADAMAQLKILCQDQTPENLAIVNKVNRGRVLARAFILAYEKKKPKIISMAAKKAGLKNVTNTVQGLEDMVSENMGTRKLLDAIGVKLHKRKIAKGKKKKVTAMDYNALKGIFSDDEMKQLFEVKK